LIFFCYSVFFAFDWCSRKNLHLIYRKWAGDDKFLPYEVPGQKIIITKEAIYFGNKLQRLIVVYDILCGKGRVFQYKQCKVDTENKIDKQSTSSDATVSIYNLK